MSEGNIMSKLNSKTALLLAAPLALLFTPQLAMAAGDLPSMLAVDPNDKSVEYMRYIFGNSVNIIFGNDGPEQPDSMLGALSEVLNAGMLAFTGLILTYVFVTGLLNSAHEATPLGKAYSSMWIPIRMTLALALILPFAGGYSSMQLGVLWIAGHGVGLANTTWNRALDFMDSNGSLYPMQPSFNTRALAKDILRSRMCVAGINYADKIHNLHDRPINITSLDRTIIVRGQSYTSVYANAKEASSARKANRGDGVNPAHYGAEGCGDVQMSFKAGDISLGQGIGDASLFFSESVLSALVELDKSMNDLAKSLIRSKELGEAMPSESAILTAAQRFDVKYAAAYADAQQRVSQVKGAQWDDSKGPANMMSKEGSRVSGWITAGAWYWEFQKINQAATEALTANLATSKPSGAVTSHPAYNSIMKFYDDFAGSSITTDKFGNIVTENEAATSSKDTSFLEKIGLAPWISNPVLHLVEITVEIMSDANDPVQGAANVGHSILTAASIVYVATTILNTAMDTVDKGYEQATPRLLKLKGLIVWGVAKGIGRTIRDTIIKAPILLLPIGLMLAFYLPATPMILWIMGVAGWYVLLIEAVIAAPIWAASHAMPEGNGFVGQRAMAGYMVILSLFVRPTLMLFGFFASMVLMIVMGKVLNLLFLPEIASITSGYTKGLLTYFGVMTIYTLLIVQIAHRSYGLIHELPDKILRFIGGGRENLGEAGQETSGRQIFVGAAVAMRGAGTSGGTAAAATQNKPSGDGDGDGDNKSGDNNKNVNNKNLTQKQK